MTLLSSRLFWRHSDDSESVCIAGLPFVFARAGRPFVSSILPMLVGMALTFALVATLAAVGGGWVVQANEYGRIAAMVLLAGSSGCCCCGPVWQTIHATVGCLG